MPSDPSYVWGTVTNGSTQARSNSLVAGSVRPDSREVAISSDLEPTYYKDSITGHRTQHTRPADGSMAADTVAPDSNGGGTGHIQYSPIYSRSSWSRASTYAWKFASGGDSIDPQSGTFNTILYDVSSPEISYYPSTNGPGSSEAVTLTLTDSGDGAAAANSYSVSFHNYYEQWKRLARTYHPLSSSYANPASSSEWTRLVTVDSPRSVVSTAHLNQAYSDSVTQSGTIGGQGGLTVPGIAAFQANENITNGATSTGTLTTSYDFPGMAYTRITYYAAKTYEECAGTVDAYLANGFQGTQAWYGIFATNPMVLSTTYTDDHDYPYIPPPAPPTHGPGGGPQ